MNRKHFIKKGIAGFTGIVGIPSLLSSCKNDDFDPSSCEESPEETAGPFPIKTPAELVRENIIGDRTGVPMMITVNIQDVNNACSPIEGALVDIWHCDADGNYSEYAGQLDGDFTSNSFLRGRQTTDADGNASFISVFPGWYPGRTPHIHLEVKSSTGDSLLITQISWSDDVSDTVYDSPAYSGAADTNNSNDGLVDDSNLADSLTGNITDGYVLMKNIKVEALA